MKENKNAMFLLEAIGELSEETVAEAKRPIVMPLRRLVAAAAAVVIVGTLAVVFALTGNRPGQPTYPSVTPSEQENTANITLETAVETARNKLSESGITAELDDAYLTSDGQRMYYVISFSTKMSAYDCSVDAQSGELFQIAERIEETETEVYYAPEPSDSDDDDNDSSEQEDQDDHSETASGDYLSGTIRFVKEAVGDVCEIGGPLYAEYWCDSGWRDWHTVALITSQSQMDQFLSDYGIVKGFSFYHNGLDQYDWDYYGMIAVVNTREDNITVDLTELRRDESSASFYAYFRESAVISNEPLDNITDIKLYRIRLTDCEGIRGFYL